MNKIILLKIISKLNTGIGEENFIWIFDREEQCIKRVPWYCTCSQAHIDNLAIQELEDLLSPTPSKEE